MKVRGLFNNMNSALLTLSNYKVYYYYFIIFTMIGWLSWGYISESVLLSVLPLIHLNKYPNAPIWGLILGDATISNCNLRNPKHNSRLMLGQGGSHLSYLEYIYSTLVTAGVKCGKISVSHRLDPRTNKSYLKAVFYTSRDSYWSELRPIFYENGIKRIPMNLGEYITAMDLAFWMMDDG
uniref:LAGLIDADG endonuclease n=1 Tax=Spizellomyces sp. 'palustris' TaxID=117820 RepID=UPI0010FBCEE3|nr:LAGLIDADG endonuclease [Spizellomyces sp. 'palustris']QCQ69044.1 LAGLIDADG endonuclease [Spizellomyces sp. 'palustris']